ncbi:titin homolog isoform X3 [Etheostoma spectabile]|uniref:titin homolog isoform X3 n=1 Tax=Etheostoma spectabile TaxID=54343 RepID=UPI0013AF99CB|nr:titin homolog isoform X3 [Etheostoma spectabile]
MKFPVDLLADVSQTELERLAHNYMKNLLYSNPDAPEHLTLPDSTQVTINICSVGFVPLYGSNDKQKVLALFSPTEPLTAVALYLLDQWWPVDDILKTADPARDGAVEVETVGERIVLYILNRVVYRAREMSSEELPFLCHGEKDHAKILWSNGEAVGFYSVKPSGSFSNSFATRSYQLPVMDSIFVRRCQRGKGFGLQMLEDFVLSFKEDHLGLRYPLTKAMYKVCEKYLRQYPGDTDLLWEVESIGGPNQRHNLARKIQAMDPSAVSRSLSFTEESPVITEMTEKDMVMEAITTQIKEAESMECTVEIVEEVTVLSATKGLEAEVPLTARGRSSGSKRRKTAEEKVIRIEDIEAETPREEQEIVSDPMQTEGVSVAPEEQGQDVVDTAATMSEQPDAVLKPQDPETADVTSAATTEEAPLEADAPQDVNNTARDSQIIVENVASEIEEECVEEDTAAPAVSEEMLELDMEEETLDKVGEETQITDEKWEKRVPQHEVSPSPCEAGRTTGQSKTPRRRNTHIQEGVKEDTPAQEGGIRLRRRTVMNTPTPKRKYTKPRQKVCDDSEKEVEKVAEENDISPEGVEELAETGEGVKEDAVELEELREKKLEDEQLTHEEKTDMMGAALTEEEEGENVTHGSEREKEAQLEAGASAGGEQAHGQVEEQDEVADRPEEELSTKELSAVEEETIPKAEEAAGDVITSTGGNEEESKDETEQGEAISVSANADENTVAVETAVRDTAAVVETAVRQAEESQENDSGSLTSKLQKATVILVDIKTTCHHLSVKKADETAADGQSADAEKQQEGENGGKEEDITDTCVEAQTAEKEQQDNSEKEESVEEEKSEAEEALVPETRDNTSEGVCEEAAKGPDEVEEKQAADGEPEDADESPPAAEVDKADKTMSLEEEEAPVVETRALRSGTKTSTATPRCKTTRSKKQVDAHEAVTARAGETLSASHTPKGKSRKGHKHSQELEQKGGEDTGAEEEEAAKEAAEEKTDVEGEESVEEEGEEKVEEEGKAEEAASEREESVEPEIDVEEGEAVAERGREAAEDPSGGVSRDADREEETLGEECGERKAAMGGEEGELAAATVTRSLRSGGKTPKAPKSRSRRSKKQPEEEEEGQRQLQNQGEGPKESAEEAEEETGLGSVEDPPTEAVPAETGEAAVIEEEAAEDSVQGGDTDTSLPKLSADSAVLPPSGEEEQRAARVSVSHTDIQEEEEALPNEAEEQKEEAAIADEDVPEGTENTELEKVTVEEDDKMEAVPTADPGEGGTDEEEAEGVNDEEQEAPVPETRARRSRKQAGPATATSRLTRSRQENAEVAASESQKSTDQVRVLRGGRKLIPVTQRQTIKRTHPEGEGEEGGDESAAGEARETQEEGDQQQAKRLDERDATGRVETMDAGMSKDKEETGAEEAVLQLDASEEGQAHRAGTAADVDTDVGQPADEGKSSDVQEDVVPRQDTAEGEQSTSAVTGSARETLETAKDGEEKGVSEEEEATRGRTTNRREEEAAGETSSEVETRVLRKGRRSAAATPQRKPKRVRTQPQTEEEEEHAPAEKTQAEETKADEKEDNSDEKTEEDGSEAAAEKEEATQPEVEVEKEEAVAEEEDRSAVSKPCGDGQGETSAGEQAEETPNTDEGKVTDQEEAASVETTGLRSGKNIGRATTRSKTTKSQEEEAAGEKSTEDEEPAVESRVLRGGKRSAAATPRLKSKRFRTQPQTKEDDEEEEEAAPAKETQAEEAKVDEKEDNSDEKTEEKDGGEASAQKEEEARQEAPEEKGEAAEEEGNRMEMDKEVLEEESAVGDAGQMKEVVPEEDEEEDNSVEETASAEVEETKSAEEEEEEEEAPAVTSRALRSRTQRSRRGGGQTQQQEEEEEVHQSTGGSPRRSVRKKPRVDYRENNEEGERGEMEVTADQQDEEEDTEDGNALSSEEQPAEKLDTLSLVLDTDEEGETAEDEEEAEPVVIGKRVLRGRSVPSVIITPQAKSTRRSARVQKAEEDEEKSLRSAQKRRKAEGTPARRAQRRSRV